MRNDAWFVTAGQPRFTPVHDYAGGRAATARPPAFAAPLWRDQPCLVSQKILLISSILARSSSACATSTLPLVPAAPASLVASLNSVCSCGYFAKCGGL